jgi:hypothetical protein
MAATPLINKVLPVTARTPTLSEPHPVDNFVENSVDIHRITWGILLGMILSIYPQGVRYTNLEPASQQALHMW